MSMFKKLVRNKMWVLLLMFAAFFGTDAVAQDGEWEYLVAPYLLGAGLDGTTGIRGREVEVDASFGDVLENLEFGFMGHFEGRNDKWVLTGDIFYAGLGTSTSTTPSADIDLDLWIIDGGGGRRLNKNFEVLFGGRIVHVGGKIQFQGPLGILVEGDKTWFDPYVGARAILPLSEKAAITLRGDIGGFSVGSEFAWMVTPAFLYQISDNLHLLAFYRFQSFDYENEDNGFIFDFLISGPGFGLGYRF